MAAKKTCAPGGKKHKSIEPFIELFIKAEESDFLSGRSGKWGNCCFDWLINAKNMVKVLEGNYDNRFPNKPPPNMPSAYAGLQKWSEAE